MRSLSSLLALAAVIVGVVAHHVSFNHRPDRAELFKRQNPGACQYPLHVALAYNALSFFHLGGFCTAWNEVKPKTVATTTSTSTSLTTQITLTTSSIVIPSTSQATTVTTTTTTIPSTVRAASSTSTTFTTTITYVPTTYTTTIRTTTTSTSTTAIINVDDKRKRALTSKISEVRMFADGVVSSACSCVATTPSVTQTVSTGSPLTVHATNTVFVTTTRVVTTATSTSTSVIQQLSLTTTTPTTVVTTITVLTSPTTVSTATRTSTFTDYRLEIVDIIIIPIYLDGCTVGTHYQKISNLGTNFDAAARACARICWTTGKPNCDDFFTETLLPSGQINCYLLRPQDEVNTNFFCNQPSIGRAAEWIIIY